MANDGRSDPGTPLQASVGEQLAEKAHLDETAAGERRESEQAHARVDRKKAGERESVAQHLEASGAGSPEGWRETREHARELGRNRVAARSLVDTLLPLAGAVALVLGLVGRGRLKRVLLAAGLPIVWAAIARRRARGAAAA